MKITKVRKGENSRQMNNEQRNRRTDEQGTEEQMNRGIRNEGGEVVFVTKRSTPGTECLLTFNHSFTADH
jgi:hypothetical protein